MCSRTIMLADGTEVACRRCNECIAVRKSAWVGRAYMEKLTNKFSYSITLTYADNTQHQRDGAAAFRYSDIILFNKSLRRQQKYHLKSDHALRYLVAGEKGSKKDRCHWHFLSFGNDDILSLGKWELTHTGAKVTDREKKITTDPNSPIQLTWSLWPHGLVVIQEPDQSGIAYAISYALKDQFNIVNSKDTARHHKADNQGSGMFRMGKTPPIGMPYLKQLVKGWSEELIVPPTLKIWMPDYRGYYVPDGYLLQYLCRSMYIINSIHFDKYGRDALGYSSLLSEYKDHEKATEMLKYGTFTEQEFLDEQQRKSDGADPWTDYDDLARSIRVGGLQRVQDAANKRIRKSCGNFRPCNSCKRLLGGKLVEREGRARYEAAGFFSESIPIDESLDNLDAHYSTVIKSPSPFCQNRAKARYRTCFPSGSGDTDFEGNYLKGLGFEADM